MDKLKRRDVFTDVKYLNVPQFKVNERWILETETVQNKLQLFEEKCQKKQENKILYLFNEINKNDFHTIGEFCDIGNGLVSGLDKAFQVNGDSLNKTEKQAIIKVVKAKNLNPFYPDNITPYIYIPEGLNEEEVREKYPNFYAHFQLFKNQLEKRYQYNKKINIWEWVFMRNFNLFSRNEKRIFVPCKERISNKNYFRFSLIDQGIYPTQDVTAIFKKPKTKESIEYIMAYLNSPLVFEWLKYNGIVKGNIVEFSEKPIYSIPFKAINWDCSQEVHLHNTITDLSKHYIKTKNTSYLKEINNSIDKLIAI